MINTNKKEDSKGWTIYISIFLTTMALFIYETLLTRMFSAILTHSLVFIVVSFAILGGGIGSILTYKMFMKNNRDEKALITSTILLPISFIVSIAIMYFLPFAPTFLLYIPAALLPFILGGIIISILFMKNPNQSNKLYLMDLFGAGFGSLLVIKMMNSFGFLRSIIIVSILAIISAIGISIYFKSRKTITLTLGFLIIISLLIANNGLIEIIGNNFYSYYTSPGTIMGNIKSSKGNAEILYSKWDAISRTDVIEVEGEKDKLIVTDGGATAPIREFNGDLNSIQDMKSDVKYLPFSFGKNETALLIGSGGGKDVLYALLGGNTEIDAVEINPSTIKAVNEFKEFSGDIYNYPGVQLYNQDGRYFIENSSKKYDNIYLSQVMTNSVENNMYSLAEYYIFTEEAFKQYFDHLTNAGKLTFVVHNTMDLSKVVNTGIQVLINKGIEEKDVTNYFTIVNGMTKEQSEKHGSQVSMPVVVFKNTPFSQQDVESIINTANMQNRDIIHTSGYEVDPYKFLKDGTKSFDEIIKNTNFNAKPITDDSPFFYNYSKYIPMEMTLILILILGVIVYMRKKFIRKVNQRKASVYFGGIGIAFMLVEIPLIQKMVLYFGSSSLAFSFIVFTLLISSGIGSLISGFKMIEKFTAKSPYYILAAGLLIILNQRGISYIVEFTNDWDIIYKLILIFINTFPMGLLMGMAFPSGIKKLGTIKKKQNLIPLMIGVNGIFSVLGSTLAVILSMLFGFNLTILVGATIYILIFISNPLRNFDCG